MKKLSILAGALLAATALVAAGSNAATAAAAPVCNLKSAGGQIKHVVYIQFDNLHLNRDNPNVPSDLEQIPSLMNFLQGQGTLMSNHHTALIAHTTTGILTSFTGLYGDRMGVPVSNSFLSYIASGKASFPSAFAYWNDKVQDSTGFNQTTNMLNELGVTAPAPWVPYTRSGCDVGMVASANAVLENVNTSPTGDIATIFGTNSAEFAETKNNRTLATADFEGIVIHCGFNSPTCAGANARADLLPQEAGGYKGYKALFGHKYVAQQIGAIQDLNGNPVKDSNGNVGFPGFDGMEAPVSLGYVAQLLEANIPVVYAYISDAHDNHVSGGTFGPGEAGYVAQLRSYDDAFTKFFARLKKDGIDQTNTLFVFTADEGDHFVGAQLNNCDGVTTPCVYNHSTTVNGKVVPSPQGTNVGEISADLAAMLKAQRNNTSGFDYHFDSAPAVYVFGTPGPVIPSQTDPVVRQLERDVGALTAMNPLRGTTDVLTQRMVDHAAMKTLHMLTRDPLRTPTFVMFANADYFFSSSAQLADGSVIENSGFAWNHGDFQNEIAQTWLGMVGPGIQGGRDNTTWSDHVDIRPTMLAVLGLRDTYIHDGRVLIEAINDAALPTSLAQSRAAYLSLGVAYKQMNAPFQDLGQAVLNISTKGLIGGSAGNDAQYQSAQTTINNLTASRDALAAQVKSLLNGTAFKNAPLSAAQAQGFVSQAQALVAQAIAAQ